MFWTLLTHCNSSKWLLSVWLLMCLLCPFSGSISHAYHFLKSQKIITYSTMLVKSVLKIMFMVCGFSGLSDLNLLAKETQYMYSKNRATDGIWASGWTAESKTVSSEQMWQRRHYWSILVNSEFTASHHTLLLFWRTVALVYD